MVRLTRRRVVAAGSALAFAGCMGTDDGDDETTAPQSSGGLPEGLRRALAPIPTRAGDRTLQGVATRDVSRLDEQELMQTGLDRSSVDYAIRAEYDDGGLLFSYTGSFDADAPEKLFDGSGDASYRADGRYVGAGVFGEGPWQDGIDAVETVIEDSSKGLLADDLVAETMAPVGGAPRVQLSADPNRAFFTGISDVADIDDIEYTATDHGENEDVTLTMAIGFRAEASAPDSVPDGASLSGRVVESAERRGRVLVVELGDTATGEDQPATTIEMVTTVAAPESSDEDR